jgi:hypothetical protein
MLLMATFPTTIPDQKVLAASERKTKTGKRGLTLSSNILQL